MRSLARRNVGFGGNMLRPFADDIFDGIFRELSVDRVLDDVFGSSFGARANVISVEGGSQIEIEAPGMSKSDFKIEAEDGTLKVSAHAEKKAGSANHREFMKRSFSRSFVLPEGTRVDAIKASYDAGILRIEVPHEPQQQRREAVTIDIA